MILNISTTDENPEISLISIGRGCVTKVDSADIHLVDGIAWISRKSRSKTYVCARNGPKGRYLILMHRLIFGLDVARVDPRRVDHINGDSLDNRRSNLRLATRQQNLWNYPKTSLGHPLFKGIRRHKNRWKACITLNNKYRHIGSFLTEEEAARAYDRAAINLFGEFARLNFPKSDYLVG